MEILIRKLSPELINDYLEFFDQVAFTDNEEWDGCYCVFYHWNASYEEECGKCGKEDTKSFNRGLAVKLIQSGTLQGYLAYADNSVVGWCNANDKSCIEGINKQNWPELWEDTDPVDKVKSIVCFTIAPKMRRYGIATKLLQRVCEDAAREGYDYVEAYPGKSADNVHRNYHGPVKLYEQNGFTILKDLEQNTIARSYLNKKRNILTETARNQFASTFQMLDTLVKVCNDSVWYNRYHDSPFWYQVYHAVYFIDYWFREAYDGSEFRSMILEQEIPPEFEQEIGTELKISRETMQEYLDRLREKITRFFDRLDDEKLASPIVQGAPHYTYLDVIMTQNRHVMYNIGYLNGILRGEAAEESDWYSYNEKN